jgi:hypothetical protein
MFKFQQMCQCNQIEMLQKNSDSRKRLFTLTPTTSSQQRPAKIVARSNMPCSSSVNNLQYGNNIDKSCYNNKKVFED